jgi:uncharacterized protein Smg (DUF494 family)
MSRMGVIGGKIVQKNLTHKIDEETYDIGKAYFWMQLLKDGMRPKKWLKPNSKGTSVNFATISNKEEMNTAYGEFEGYLKFVNEKHDTDLEIVEKGETNEYNKT